MDLPIEGERHHPWMVKPFVSGIEVGRTRAKGEEGAQGDAFSLKYALVYVLILFFRTNFCGIEIPQPLSDLYRFFQEPKSSSFFILPREKKIENAFLDRYVFPFYICTFDLRIHPILSQSEVQEESRVSSIERIRISPVVRGEFTTIPSFNLCVLTFAAVENLASNLSIARIASRQISLQLWSLHSVLQLFHSFGHGISFLHHLPHSIGLRLTYFSYSY
jgi:hypothetical protein